MLNTLFTGQKLIHHSQTGSTNTDAMDLAKHNPPDGTTIYTMNQMAGRGQKGNSWETEPGQNLAVSIIYYPNFLAGKEVFAISKIVSLAVRECIAKWAPLADVQIKWPNDIFADGKKICGILIENQMEAQHVKNSIIGIGININQQQFSPEITERTTSLSSLTRQHFEVPKVLYSLLNILEQWYLRLKRGEYPYIDREYYAHLLGYQERRRFEVEGTEIEALILGVDSYGRLALQISETIKYFDIKEVKMIL